MHIFLMPHIIIDHVDCVVSDAVCQSSRAEEMPFWIAKPEMLIGTEKFVAQISFQKLQCLALRHARQRLNADVDMLWHDAKNPYGHLMPCRCLSEDFFRKNFILLLLEHPVGVFCAPLKMGHVYANLMRMVP